MAEPPKPLAPAKRALRVFWAGWIIVGLVFCLLMAAWGDLRQGLMLRLLDDRYNKSFTIQAPEGTKIWLGTQYLGECQPHPLSDGEPEDSELKIEGMNVLLPRVYFYEPQLLEQSISYEPANATADLLAKLVPDAKPLWVERETFGDAGFVPALLKHDDGRLDLLTLARVDWPTSNGGFERRAFVLRVVADENHLFHLKEAEIWSDQISADEGGFWPQRQEFDGYPVPLKGQSKTAWRWFIHTEHPQAFMETHDHFGVTDIKWFRLAETN